MGVEFLEKVSRSCKKSWDRSRVMLGTADLFKREPTCQGRTTAADIIGNSKLSKGDTLVVQKSGESLIARRGNTEVARIDKPQPDQLRAVEASCGVAKGTVEEVHDRARVVEITLC